MLDDTTQGTTTDKTSHKTSNHFEQAIESFLRSADKLKLFRAETGTGKSTAIRSHLNKGTSLRVALVVYSQVEVDSLWQELEEKDVKNVVGWSAAHDQNNQVSESSVYKKSYKEDLRNAQIVIVTHAFIGNGNKRYLGDRDIFLVDENPNWPKFETVAAKDITEVIDSLNSRGAATRREAYAGLTGMMHTIEPKDKFTPLSHPDLCDIAKAVEALGMDIEEANISTEKEIGRLAQALRYGRAVLCKAENLQKAIDGHTVHFAFTCKNPLRDEKVMILSATAHLGGYKRANEKVPLISPVDYSNLEIVKLPYPNISTQKDKLTDNDKETVNSILQQILNQTKCDVLIVAHLSWRGWIAESIYKQMTFSVDGESVNYKELPKINTGTRTIHFTNHGRDIGSNNYREVEDVIYLDLFYTKREVDVMEALYHTEGSITADVLKDAQSRNLTGMFKDYRENSLKDEFKQMLARGKCREVSGEGVASAMRAWVLIKQPDWLFADIQNLFPKCKVLEDHDIIYPTLPPTTKQGKVVVALNSLEPSTSTITAKDLQHLIKKRYEKGPTLSNHGNDIPSWIEHTQWTYVRGERGRGAAMFTRKTNTSLGS